jgi:hypothetical protein
MPFPTVMHCLVCEELRREFAGKSTILGFYGIAPEVTIVVGKLGQPIQRLMFVLLAAPATEAGTYSAKPQLFGPDGAPVGGQVPAMAVGLEAGEGRHLLAFGFIGPVFTQAGLHRFVLSVEGNEHFRAEFAVEEGPTGAPTPAH